MSINRLYLRCESHSAFREVTKNDFVGEWMIFDNDKIGHCPARPKRGATCNYVLVSLPFVEPPKDVAECEHSFIPFISHQGKELGVYCRDCGSDINDKE